MPVNTNDMSSGSVIYDIRQPDTIIAGQKAVATAGTRVPLGTTVALESGVRIKAKIGNTGDIYVGDSAVDSTHGFVLDGGDEVFIEIDDLAKVYIDSGTNGDGVSYIGS